MLLCCDRTGFPVVRIPPLGIAVHLFPMTKIQLEQFLGESRTFSDSWYQQILTLNPRVSWRQFSGADRERMFATGLLFPEVEAVAAWMGPGWFIPAVPLWRQIWAGFARISLTQAFLDGLPKNSMHPAAIGLVRGVLGQVQPSNILEFSLMRGGVMEWVRDQDGWGALGEPRTDFAQHPGNPLASRPIRPITDSVRLFSFGFRLCQVLEAEKPKRGHTGPEWPGELRF